MKNTPLLIFLLSFSLLGCGGKQSPTGKGIVEKIFNSGDFPSIPLIDNDEGYLDFYKNHDMTITIHGAGYSGMGNSFFANYSGLPSDDWFLNIKHSNKYKYVYQSFVSSDKSRNIEELYWADEQTNKINNITINGNISNYHSFNHEEINIDKEFFPCTAFNVFQYVNPFINKAIKNMDWNLGDDPEYNKYWWNHGFSEYFMSYLFYVVDNPEKAETYSFISQAGDRVTETINYPISISDYSIESIENTVDIKYTVENHQNQYIGSYSYNRETGTDMADVTYHYVFRDNLPVYFSRYYALKGNQTYAQIESGYNDAVIISYDELPSDPMKLIGKDNRVSDETNLFNFEIKKEATFLDEKHSTVNKVINPDIPEYERLISPIMFKQYLFNNHSEITMIDNSIYSYEFDSESLVKAVSSDQIEYYKPILPDANQRKIILTIDKQIDSIEVLGVIVKDSKGNVLGRYNVLGTFNNIDLNQIAEISKGERNDIVLSFKDLSDYHAIIGLAFNSATVELNDGKILNFGTSSAYKRNNSDSRIDALTMSFIENGAYVDNIKSIKLEKIMVVLDRYNIFIDQLVV